MHKSRSTRLQLAWCWTALVLYRSTVSSRAFGEVDAFCGIEVTVRHGVAHLQGTVVQPQEAAAVDVSQEV